MAAARRRDRRGCQVSVAAPRAGQGRRASRLAALSVSGDREARSCVLCRQGVSTRPPPFARVSGEEWATARPCRPIARARPVCHDPASNRARGDGNSLSGKGRTGNHAVTRQAAHGQRRAIAHRNPVECAATASTDRAQRIAGHAGQPRQRRSAITRCRGAQPDAERRFAWQEDGNGRRCASRPFRQRPATDSAPDAAVRHGTAGDPFPCRGETRRPESMLM